MIIIIKLEFSLPISLNPDLKSSVPFSLRRAQSRPFTISSLRRKTPKSDSGRSKQEVAKERSRNRGFRERGEGSSLLRCSINLGDVGEQVEDTAGVGPLVVVPGDELDEVVVEGDTGLGIEDGGGVVAVHVGRDDLILGVGEYACGLLVFIARGLETDHLPFMVVSEAFLMTALISS